MSKPSEAPTPVGYRYKFEGVEFDEAAALLKVDGQTVSLEPRPMRLLAELLHHLNEVVTRDELFESVWDGRPTVDNVLASAVNKLRKALGDPAAARVVTVPRIGYRFVGPVERIVEHIASIPAMDLQAGQAVPWREGWRLERTLGAGTRGHVWLARQVKLGGLRVFKFAADPDTLRALKREYTLYRVLREELGERDDFAQLVDCNFAAPPFFIECEYGGEDLADWAGEHLAELDLNQRLALFLQVARAVAAAHRVGVLHKDLKPANILVSPDPAWGWHARLTDFGSGRALDLERLRELQLSMQGLTLTQHLSSDALTGTPMYLAPELLAGEAPSMQSDLYALGLILFQLLVGDPRRPLATGWQRDVADPLLQQDIVAATEGRPEDRPASVQAWVEELSSLEERHARIAVQQAQEAELARLHAEAQRHQARRPWLLATFVSLLLGLVGSAGFSWQTTRQQRVAEQQVQRATAINEFMANDVLGNVGQGLIKKDGLIAISDLLQRITAKAAERFATRPVLEAEVKLQVGLSYYRQGQLANGVRELRRALALLEPFDADADVVALQATVRLKLAHVLSDLNELPEAKKHFDIAEALLREHPDKDPIAQKRVTEQTRMRLLLASGQFSEAVAPARTLAELTDTLPGQRLEPRFSARYMLGNTLFKAGNLEQSEAEFIKLLAPPFDEKTVGMPQVLRAQVHLARVHIAMGKTEGIEAILSDARAALSVHLGAQNIAVANTDGDLGDLYVRLGKFSEAAAAYQSAHDIFVVAIGPDRTHTHIMAANMAVAILNQGRVSEALGTLQKEREWLVANTGGERSSAVQVFDFHRARALTSMARSEEASAILETLDPTRINEEVPARDWRWRLEAERGRAMASHGASTTGLQRMYAAVRQMEVSGTPEWVKAEYRRLLPAGS